MNKTEYTGMTSEQLYAEKAHCEWRYHAARRVMYGVEQTVYAIAKKKMAIEDLKKTERRDALDRYIAGEITEKEYRQCVRDYNKKYETSKDLRRRFKECEEFMLQQQQNIKDINSLLRIKGYDPRRNVGKTNKPGKHPGGAPKGKVPVGAIKKGEVRNPHGYGAKVKRPEPVDTYDD